MSSKIRSPKYPFISLKRALVRAKELYDKEGRHAIPVKTATAAWSYNEKSSGGIQTIAALKTYGLLVDEGSGQARKVRFTEAALRVILDNREDSPERSALIRKLAITPKIFSELWMKWGDSNALPSDSTIRHTLVFDYNFNENVVGDFIQIFKETLDFADIRPGGSTEDFETEEESGTSATLGPARRAPLLPSFKPRPNMSQDTFTIAEGVAMLQWPSPLSQESAEDIEAWLILALRKIKRGVQVSQTQEPAPDDGSDLL